MAVKFRNGEHHRNPSGFYNKVKFLLRESKRDLGKLYQVFGDISYHNSAFDKYFNVIRKSWETAYIFAKWIIENNIDNPRDYINSFHTMIEEIKNEKHKTLSKTSNRYI
jgi:hypothetical protein